MVQFGQNLDLDRSEGISRVSALVNGAREMFAENIAFQSIAYEAKRDEAQRYIDTKPVSLEEFPLLREISAIRGENPLDLATVWLIKNDAWGGILQQTEVLREQANHSVRSANSRAEIIAAIKALENAISQIRPS